MLPDAPGRLAASAETANRAPRRGARGRLGEASGEAAAPLACRLTLGERAAVTRNEHTDRALGGGVRGVAVLAATLVALTGCGRGATPSDSAQAAAPGAAVAPPSAESNACPADGHWAECSIMERLDRAGLAPHRDSGLVHEAPLSRSGFRVKVGSADLDLYIYPDSAARAQDEAKLDGKKYIAYDAPQTMLAEPTLIHSANLLAILHSRRDQQRERVSDAITAGPPQPKAR